MMGTTISIKIVHTIHQNPKVIGIQAMNNFKEIENIFTRFKSTSELSKVNQSIGKYIPVSQTFKELLKECIEYHKETRGLFNVHLLDRIESLENGEDTHPIHCLKSPDVSFKKKTEEICVNSRIDLTGAAKGFAIRKTKEYLIKNNIENFIINAGGDIYAHGKNATGNYWKIALLDTKNSIKNQEPKFFPSVTIKNQSLSCSGIYARKLGKYHHLINPITQIPERNTLQTFVLGKDPVCTDVFATALFFTNDKIMTTIKDRGLCGAKVNTNGRVFTTGSIFKALTN